MMMDIPKNIRLRLRINGNDAYFHCHDTSPEQMECYDVKGNRALIRRVVRETSLDSGEYELQFRVSEYNDIKYKPWPKCVKDWEPGDTEKKFEPWAEIVIKESSDDGDDVLLRYRVVDGKCIPYIVACDDGYINLKWLLKWTKENLPQCMKEICDG